jgi:hypothetical protein
VDVDGHSGAFVHVHVHGYVHVYEKKSCP